MKIVRPEQLLTAIELMEAEVNFALTDHPKDDGFCKVDLSGISKNFSAEDGAMMTSQLCKKIEEAGYYCYFSSYMTFFYRIYVMISLKPFDRVYYLVDFEKVEIKKEEFQYHLPWNGYLNEKDAELAVNRIKEYKKANEDHQKRQTIRNESVIDRLLNIFR
jgi:hypothetical protein